MYMSLCTYEHCISFLHNHRHIQLSKFRGHWSICLCHDNVHMFHYSQCQTTLFCKLKQITILTPYNESFCFTLLLLFYNQFITLYVLLSNLSTLNSKITTSNKRINISKVKYEKRLPFLSD